MQDSTKSNQQYNFYYAKGKPDSLVMVSSIENALSQILNDPQTFNFIWVINDLCKLSSQQISQWQAELNISTIKFQKIQQLQQLLKDHQLNYPIVLIYPSPISPDLYKVSRYKQIKIIICYEEQKSKQKDTIQIKQYCKNITCVEDKSQLQYYLQVYNKIQKKRQFKTLTNFVSLRSQVSMSNYLIKAIFGMLNQEIQAEVNNQMVNRLKKISTKLQECSEQQKLGSKFFNQLKNGMSFQRAIYWYTQDTPIFKIINNIFRSATHSTQIYYIQPYFKILFQAIKSLYLNSLINNQLKFLTCYRGGTITEKQFQQFTNNIGGYVQNLGFLSTSLSLSQAELFVKNVYFQIVINNQKIWMQQNNGYALVTDQSAFSNEKQILFNPLNNFKILQAKQTIKQKSIYYIKLQYNSLSILFHTQQSSLKKQQKMWKKFIQFQLQQKNNIKSQKFIFQSQRGTKKCLQYWKKYIQIAEKQIQEHDQSEDIKKLYVYGINSLATILNQNNQLNIALDYYTKALTLAENVYGKQHRNYSVIQYGIASLYLNKNQFQKSIALYQNYLKNIKQKDGIFSLHYANTLNNIGLVYQKAGEINKAIVYLNQSLSINKQLNSQNHPLFAQVLNNLGSLYKKKCNYQKALHCYLLSIQTIKFFYGQIHIKYIHNLHNIASAYIHLGYANKSLQILQNCLHILSKIKQQSKIQYKDIYHTLALAYYMIDNKQKAIQCAQIALQLNQKISKQSPEQQIKLINIISIIWQCKNLYIPLLTLYKKQADIIIQLYGIQNIDYVDIVIKQAYALSKQTKYQQAINKYRQALKIVRIIQISNDNLKEVYILHNMARAYMYCGKLQESQEYCLQAYQIVKKKDNIGCMIFINVLNTLAGIYTVKKQFSRSIKYYYNALKLAQHSQLYMQHIYCQIICNISINISKMGLLNQAIHKLQTCIKKLYKMYNKQQDRYLRCKNLYLQLIKLYLYKGQYIKTINYYKNNIQKNLYLQHKSNLFGKFPLLKSRIFIYIYQKQKAIKLLSQYVPQKDDKQRYKMLKKSVKINKRQGYINNFYFGSFIDLMC